MWYANSVIIDVSFRKPGMRRKGDINAIDTDSDKTMLSLTKEIVDSNEYRKIGTIIARCRKDICKMLYGRGEVNAPNVFKRGAYLVPLQYVEDVVARIKMAECEYKQAVAEFLEVYPSQIKEARLRLNGQFREEDYPSVGELVNAFQVRYQILSLGIPSAEQIGEQLRREEYMRRSAEWNTLRDEVRAALRESFKQLVDHLVDRLKPDPDGKKKVLRDSAVENILDFIDKFQTRNIAADNVMAVLVDEAKTIIAGVPPSLLRKDEPLRQVVAERMATVKEVLDQVISTTPRRAFTFEED